MSNLTRVQMLLEPKQHEELKRIAQERGTSVAELAREAINQWLESLKLDGIRRQHLEALDRLRELREQSVQQHGKPLELDVVADLNAMREERDDDLSASRDRFKHSGVGGSQYG